MNLTKEKIYGYIGSLLLCALLLLMLWFSVLKTIVPAGEEGVLVNFGNVDEASGTFEPGNSGDNVSEVPVKPVVEPVPESHSKPTPPTPQTAITQNLEQTAAIEAEKKKKEEAKRQAEAERKRKEEEQRRQQAISNQVAGAFGAGNTQSSGQGTGNGSGNQGSPQGNSSQGANSGVGGYGDFSLSGRSLGPGGLPRPAYSIQEEGIIVIDITVDKNGNVILATIGKGTNIDNSTMRQSALDAAKKAKFNTISGNENQSGKITYRYKLN